MQGITISKISGRLSIVPGQKAKIFLISNLGDYFNPLQSVPVQSWTFKTESSIRIGRFTDNEVVLYSAEVSRRHVEIKQSDDNWEVINLGANGTYIDGKRISQTLLEDTMIIRLAASGPKIQIRLGEFEADPLLPVVTDKEPDGGVRDSRRDTLIN